MQNYFQFLATGPEDKGYKRQCFNQCRPLPEECKSGLFLSCLFYEAVIPELLKVHRVRIQ
jgi:hypothetical protein